MRYFALQNTRIRRAIGNAAAAAFANTPGFL
jgi:hypothetical protein